MSTAERLAEAMVEAGCPADMITRARAGYYDDYRSPLPFPITQLVDDLRDTGHYDLARRAMDGDFDGTREEADAWAASPEGQQVFRDLLGGK